MDEDMSPSSTDLYLAWFELGVRRGGLDCVRMRGRRPIGAWMENIFVEMDRHAIAFF